jgi:hypothetical protein
VSRRIENFFRAFAPSTRPDAEIGLRLPQRLEIGNFI